MRILQARILEWVAISFSKRDFPGGSDGKVSVYNAGDPGQSLGWEDPLEGGMATHSSILAWRIRMDRGAWCATVHGVTKSQAQLNTHYLSL